MERILRSHRPWNAVTTVRTHFGGGAPHSTGDTLLEGSVPNEPLDQQITLALQYLTVSLWTKPGVQR